jgi:diketogulonate reductase-like aldo/keto reductase
MPMTYTLQSKVILNNGIAIPQLGLGVYQAHSGGETLNAVLHALKTGYRHIDTAAFYRNESDVGDAIIKSNVGRDDIWITTKLWNDAHGYDSTVRACLESLSNLNVKVIDLYLIHYPVKDLRQESWRALETLYEEGKCRAIGVSNYTMRHITELLGTCKIKPAVNQVEFHPYLYQKELLDFCRSQNIALEAYSPLTKGRRLDDPKLNALAKNYSKSPAQILIRWALQHELIVIPKSSKPRRIDENASVFDFEISPNDMEVLNSFHENLRVAWDPTLAP